MFELISVNDNNYVITKSGKRIADIYLNVYENYEGNISFNFLNTYLLSDIKEIMSLIVSKVKKEKGTSIVVVYEKKLKNIELLKYLEDNYEFKSYGFIRRYKNNCKFKTKVKPVLATKDEVLKCIDLRALAVTDVNIREFPYYKEQFQRFSTYIIKENEKIMGYVNYNIKKAERICDLIDLYTIKEEYERILVYHVFNEAYKNNCKCTNIIDTVANHSANIWRQFGCEPIFYLFSRYF